MLSVNPFHDAVSAASDLLSAVSTALHPFGGAALAIVLVTIAVRLALHPLNRAAVRGERARTRLAPKVAAIRARHGGDTVRMGSELRELYRAERISPFAGLLPLLVQAPIFLVLYRTFATANGSLAAASLFGVPLHTRFATGAIALGPHVLVFAAIFAALIALAVIGSRRAAMTARANAAAAAPPKRPGLRTAAATGAVAGGAAVGTAEIMTRIGQIAPFFVLISAAVLPLATVLYLLTTTTWSTAENALLRRGLPA
jgi:YidC/Oxa1 family membrane protein insertase